jgi:hypothetical protein
MGELPVHCGGRPGGGAVELGVGLAVGAAVGVVVVGAVAVGVAEPVQVVPLRVKLVGEGLLLVHAPLKPKATLALAAIVAL